MGDGPSVRPLCTAPRLGWCESRPRGESCGVLGGTFGGYSRRLCLSGISACVDLAGCGGSGDLPVRAAAIPGQLSFDCVGHAGGSSFGNCCCRRTNICVSVLECCEDWT